MIGGPQGSGINTVAENFARACCRGGLHVFANIEYHSNIKGEHSYYRLRIEDREVRSHLEMVDVLVALDKETLFGDLHKEMPTHNGHRHEVAPGGAIVYDSQIKFAEAELGRPDAKLLAVPYKNVLFQVLKEFGKEKELSTYQVMVNTVAFGASVGFVDYDFDLIAQTIREGFSAKKAQLADMNVRAVRAGYDYVRENYGKALEPKIRRLENPEKRMLIRGVESIAIAKLKAGCAFQTYYPITPATDESVYLEARQRDYPIVVVQSEDEIAAINMATGAAHGGARASTSTSGPGFSLMAEGLGWSGITEAPGPVIILYQRAGPATGLPTRSEQGDLRFALHAAHGEFPRIIITPGDVEESFYETFEAFNYAERYQVPVILMVDKYLASSYRTMRIFDGGHLKVDRGSLLTDEQLAKIEDYKRYQFSEIGISPRSIPGQSGGIYWTSGDEHDERGHITESAENRTKMMAKRMRKLELAALEISDDRKASLHGPRKADATVVSWGSTKGPILDAMSELEKEGLGINFLQIRYMSPFPSEFVSKILSGARRKIGIECNYSGQLAGLVCERTGIMLDRKILKYNGRPFSQDEICEGIKDALRDGIKEVVMTHA